MRIVLVEPEIPQNTGSIARTCAATRTPLHLVGKLGFEINEKRVRRAGLDYWPYVELHIHSTWEDFIDACKPGGIWLFTKFAERIYHQAEFKKGDALVFGSETKGLGREFLANFPDEQKLKIPMSCAEVRSLNLSNAASVALYEARRQLSLDRI